MLTIFCRPTSSGYRSSTTRCGTRFSHVHIVAASPQTSADFWYRKSRPEGLQLVRDFRSLPHFPSVLI